MTFTRISKMNDSHTSPHNIIDLPARTNDSPQRKASDFVREHPVLIVAGGVALGALAAALLPKSTRRRLTRRAGGLIEVATTAGLALGREALLRAESTGSDIRKQGRALADRAESLGETAASRAGEFGSAAADRVGRMASPASQAAADFAGKVMEKAGDISARVRRGK
jgi:hypothetical protein